MTVVTTEMYAQVAEFSASRDAHAADRNAARLESWRRRYPHDVVEVPATTEPPKWPVIRSSIAEPAKVVKMTKARARG